MKTIHVSAAVIIDHGSVFATQRGYGEFKDGWEFPGGKIEVGETPETALIREIKEELNVTIQIESLLDRVEYDYPDFHLTMYCYICKIISGEIILNEHEDAKWLTSDTLDHVNWLPADRGLIDQLRRLL